MFGRKLKKNKSGSINYGPTIVWFFIWNCSLELLLSLQIKSLLKLMEVQCFKLTLKNLSEVTSWHTLPPLGTSFIHTYYDFQRSYFFSILSTADCRFAKEREKIECAKFMTPPAYQNLSAHFPSMLMELEMLRSNFSHDIYLHSTNQLEIAHDWTPSTSLPIQILVIFQTNLICNY